MHFNDFTVRTFAVFIPLVKVKQSFGSIRGVWDTSFDVIETKDIVDIVGIWHGITSQQIYMIRKHPGLALLSPLELGTDPNDMPGDDEGGEI